MAQIELRDFPLWLRGLLVATLLLFFWNALFALTTMFAISWKIDPGLTTLLGATFGLGIVAWQARLGFANLIRSQENQAELDRQAREHQHTLDANAAERQTIRERN